MNLRWFIPVLVIRLSVAWLPVATVGAQTPEMEVATRSANRFALNLSGEIRESDEPNLFLSPFGVYTVLSFLYAGARGETAREMAEAMHIDQSDQEFHAARAETGRLLREIGQKGDVELAIANAIWPQEGALIRDEFLSLMEKYDADLTPVDYRGDPEGSAERINRWGEDNTNGRIRDIISWRLHPETHLLLSNAIFFKGNWVRRFDEESTTERRRTGRRGR